MRNLPISSTTKLLCGIGYPTESSLAPMIYNSFLETAGLSHEYVYLTFNMDKGSCQDFLHCSKILGITGFNVMPPLTEEMYLLVDSISAESVAFGAVNTVIWKHGQFYGFNAEGDGFLKSLEGTNHDPKDKNVLLLDHSGAGRTLAQALVRGGANVSMGIKQLIMPVSGIRYLMMNQLPQMAGQFDLLINMPSAQQDESEDFSFIKTLKPGGMVYDMTLKPGKTPLMEYAESQGHPVKNGISQMCWQAAESFVLLTGKTLDRTSVEELIEEINTKVGIEI